MKEIRDTPNGPVTYVNGGKIVAECTLYFPKSWNNEASVRKVRDFVYSRFLCFCQLEHRFDDGGFTIRSYRAFRNND